MRVLTKLSQFTLSILHRRSIPRKVLQLPTTALPLTTTLVLITLSQGVVAEPISQVQATGQTQCWKEFIGTIYFIADGCNSFPGSDGKLRLGAMPERFQDNGDGTVTDTFTGLTWVKNASCFDTAQSWAGAISIANNIHDGWTGDPTGGDCGLEDGSQPGDWRLPSLAEAQTIIDQARFSPTLPNNHPFNLETVGDLSFWTSTTVAGSAGVAWVGRWQSPVSSMSIKSGTVPFFATVWPVKSAP